MEASNARAWSRRSDPIAWTMVGDEELDLWPDDLTAVLDRLETLERAVAASQDAQEATNGAGTSNDQGAASETDLGDLGAFQ